MARRTSIAMACIECNGQVQVPAYRQSVFRFCSRRCGYHWHAKNDRVDKTCTVCGKPFRVIHFREKTAKYCSRACYYRAMNGRGSVSLTCVVCGTQFQRPPSKAIYQHPVCDKVCRGLLMRTDEPNAHTYRQWMVRRGLIQRCTRCGYDRLPEILVIHHVDRDRHNNSASNLSILCPNCHAEEHYANDKRRLSSIA